MHMLTNIFTHALGRFLLLVGWLFVYNVYDAIAYKMHDAMPYNVHDVTPYKV